MQDTLNAAELRRLAMRCAAQANSANCSAIERQRLLTIREALLDLAQSADWLAGRAAAQDNSSLEESASPAYGRAILQRGL